MLGTDVIDAEKLVNRWRELKNASDAPLGVFLDWIDRSIDE